MKPFYYIVNVINNIFGNMVPGESKSYNINVVSPRKLGNPGFSVQHLRIKLKPLKEASF